MDDTLATTLPLAALDMALTQRKPSAGLVHYSDGVSNTPVKVIGGDWRWRASSPA